MPWKNNSFTSIDFYSGRTMQRIDREVAHNEFEYVKKGKIYCDFEFQERFFEFKVNIIVSCPHL